MSGILLSQQRPGDMPPHADIQQQYDQEEQYFVARQQQEAVGQADAVTPPDTAAVTQFDEGYWQGEFADNPATPERSEPSAAIQALGVQLMDEYKAAENARSMVNERWLEDLRQYKGIYDGDITRRLKKNRTSRVFYRLTTAKVNTMTARLMDLLFPQRIKNWAINATPDPSLPDELLANELAEEIAQIATGIVDAQRQELEAQGIVPGEDAIMQIITQASQAALEQVKTPENITRVAEARAQAMEQVIDDQLKECAINGQTRPSWRQNCRRVIKSACLYGMGVLKGPLVETVQQKRFRAMTDETGEVRWAEAVVAEELRPYHEAVSVWEVYPDPGARVPAELRYVWQRHVKTDKELKELLNVPGFDRDRILDYMRAHDDGDAELAQWETQMRELNADNDSGGLADMKHRYVLYERWGYLSGRELYDAGVPVPEQDWTEVYPSCVWILGNVVIKAAINPLEGVDIPYYWYPYQEDESSFWPEGICTALRHPQAAINAAVRAMQDNTALSSGPILGINMAALDESEDLDDMRAGHLFLFNQRGVSLNEAFQAVTVPSAAQENLTTVEFWSKVADETSAPRFNAGDGRVEGAGQTASGLSMLMGASNILLKDHVKDFDDNVVAPFIRAMFRWNMKWNPREDIKGDYEVVASGSQSLVAKEVRAQQVPAIIQYMGVPAFAPYIKAKDLLEVTLEQTDLPSERIMRTDDEAEQFQRQQMLMQAEAQAQAQAHALMEQLAKTGLPPEAIQQQLMQLLAATVQQSPQMAGQMAGQEAGAAPQGVPGV